MKGIVNVLKLIDKCDGPLTPHVAQLFEKTKSEALKFNILWNGGDKYQVSGPWGELCVVDIGKKSCTCRRWEITGMHCKHGVATIWNMVVNGQDVSVPKSYIDPVYRLETWKKVYSFRVDPIQDTSMWHKSRITTTLLPPYPHTPVGRPKKQRRKSSVKLESIVSGGKLSRRYKTVTCGKCGHEGHNSRGCRGQGSISHGSLSNQRRSSSHGGSKYMQSCGKCGQSRHNSRGCGTGQVGSSTQRRQSSDGLTKYLQACGKCGTPGHNARGCKSQGDSGTQESSAQAKNKRQRS